MSNEGVRSTYLLMFFACIMWTAFSFYFSFLRDMSQQTGHSPSTNPYFSEMQFRDASQQEVYRQQWFPTQSSRVILGLFDGIRYDYIVKNPLHITAQANLSEPISRLSSEPQKSVLLPGIAEYPTYTINALKSISQGTKPEQTDYQNQIKPDRITLDSIEFQEHRFSSSNTPIPIAFYGYDEWSRYFGHYFSRSFLVPDIFDYQQIIKLDDIVLERVTLEQLTNKDWSTVICHFLASDIATHHFHTTDAPEVVSNVAYLTRTMHTLIENSKTYTSHNTGSETLIFFSDHGVNPASPRMHGLSSSQEKHIFIFAYDSRGFLKENTPLNMNRTNLSSSIPVSQRDITPTYCMLRGIPIPKNNIGMIIPDFFVNDPNIDATVITNNFFINVKQLEARTSHIHSFQSSSKVASIKLIYLHLFEELALTQQISPQSLSVFVQACLAFGWEVKNLPLNAFIVPQTLSSMLTAFSFILIYAICIAIAFFPNEVNAKPTTINKSLIIFLSLFMLTAIIIRPEHSSLFAFLAILVVIVKLASSKFFAQSYGLNYEKLFLEKPTAVSRSILLLDSALFIVSSLLLAAFRFGSTTSTTTVIFQCFSLLFYAFWAYSIVSGSSTNTSTTPTYISILIIPVCLLFLNSLDSSHTILSFSLVAAFTLVFLFFSLKQLKVSRKFFFAALPIAQLFIAFNNPISKTTVSAQSLSIIIFAATELFKRFFINDVSKIWRYSSFIFNFYLLSACNTGASNGTDNQSVNMSILMLILTSLTQIHNSSSMMRRSKSSFAFLCLLAVHYFYATSHEDTLESFHSLEDTSLGLFPAIIYTTLHLFSGTILCVLFVPLLSLEYEITTPTKPSRGNYNALHSKDTDEELFIEGTEVEKTLTTIAAASTTSFRPNNAPPTHFGSQAQLTKSAILFSMHFALSLAASTIQILVNANHEDIHTTFVPEFAYQTLFAWVSTWILIVVTAALRE